MKEESNTHTPSQLAWERFKKNRLAVFGLAVIGIAFGIALLGAHLRPDASQHANNQHISLAAKGPGTVISILTLANSEASESAPFWKLLLFGGTKPTSSEIPLHSYELLQDSIKGFRYGGSNEIKGAPFAYHLLSVAYPVIPESISFQNQFYTAFLENGEQIVLHKDELKKISVDAPFVADRRFLLGTDKFGRDMLSRLMAGTIISLSVGLISVLISLLLGVSLGALAGYFGGWLDDVITWLINVVWSIPTLLLVIAITFALGKGFAQVFVAVGLTMWVEVARVVRGQILSVRNLEYVEAARVLGYSSQRIIIRHILPNIWGPVVVISAANFASAILLEAGLSFLGIGAQIPMASWGQMIKEHYPYITTSKAYLAVLPGLCIVGLVLAFMLVGNGLRDSLDTRQRA